MRHFELVALGVVGAALVSLAGCGEGDSNRRLPPETAIDDKPAALTNQTHVRITFHALGQANRFTCQLDSTAPASCTSPFEADVTDGDHRFEVAAAIDKSADVTPAVTTWTVDTIPPDTTIVSGPPALDNALAPEFTFQGTDNRGAVTFECALDDGAFAACTSPATVAVTDGSHRYTVRAVDAAGNRDPSPASAMWSVDSTAPETMISAGPAASSTTGASVTFGFGSPDSPVTFECKLDDGAFAACTSPVSFTLTDGVHTFTVRAMDETGQVDPSPVTRAWTVDATPPDVTITQNPADPSNSATSTFGFSSSDATATFECAVDAAAFAACTPGFGTGSLGDGAHTFTVRATDPVGNAATASFSWAIDTVAPTVAITSGPPAATSSTTASFTFTSGGGAVALACSLDGGPFAVCTSPRTIPGLSDGGHQFSVRATDAAGNTATDTRNWTVDTTAPVVTITSGPPNPTTDSTPTIAFTVTDATAIECQVDTGTFAACMSPFTTATLADGSHTVTVRGTDGVGNTAAASRTFTVDTVAPVVTVTPVATPISDSTPTVSFIVTGATTIECQIDTGAFAACTSPFTTATLAEGSHTITVRGSDAAGNIGTGSTTFTVDTTAPSVSVTPVASPTNDSTPAVVFTVSGATTIQCRIDVGAFAVCASPFTPSPLSDGAHTITVRGTDAAGNSDSGATSFTVDTVPPVVTVTPVASPTADNTPSVTFTVTGATTVECQIDSGVFAACTSPFTPATPLGDGSRTITVRGADAAGNVGTGSTTFTVDTGAPVVSITPVASPTNDSTPSVSFTVSGATTIECQVDTGAFVTCTSPFTPAALPDGSHTISVRGSDAAGNASTAFTSFVVDTVPPVVTVTPVASPTGDSTPSVTFTAAGATATQCQVDAGPFASCTSPFTPGAALADGSHTITVRGTDAAGNVGNGSTTFIVDTVPPTVTVTPVTTPTGDSTPSVTFTVTGATTVECQVDAGAFASCSSPFTPVAALADGTHTVTVRGTDAAGNAGTGATTFTVDTIAPVVGVTPVASPTNDNTPSVSFTVTGGATSIQCQVDSGSFTTCTSPFTPAALTDGSHTITVRGTDAAGNAGTGATTFVVDTTAPVVTVTPVASPTNDNTPAVTFTVTGATSVQCQVDAGTFAICTSPFTPAALTDGSHTVTVRGTDAVGNVGTGSTTFAVDTTPPVVTVTPVTSPTNDSTPSVSFTVTGATSIQCQVDAGSFATCTSPFTPATLIDGSHTITVRGTDAAGNSGTGATTFTVDTAAPVVTVTPVVSPTNDNTPTVTFTVTGATSIQCQVDTGTFVTCTSPFTPAALADGSHTITVRGTDAAGNSGTGATTFTVDTAAPVVTVTPVVSPTNDNTPTVTFTVTGATSIQCQVDTGTFATCTSPFTPAALADGSHTITVHGTDAAGNVGTGSTTFTVDTAGPVVTVTPVVSPTNDNTPSVSFTVTGATSIQCQVDTGSFATCTSPFTPAALADGSHTITVRGTDAAGNSDSGATVFTVDTAAPVVTVTPVASPTNDNTPSVTFTVTGATSIQCQVDTGAFTTCTSPFTPAAIADGSHTITVRGTDAAGNSGTGATTFTVDTVAPVVTVTPVASPTNDNTPSVSFTVTGATVIQCQIDTGSFATCTSPFTPASALTDGGHTITVRGTDAAGNSGTGATTFTVDTAAPPVAFDDTPPAQWPVNYFDMRFHTSDASATLSCSLNGAAFTACTSPLTVVTSYNVGSTFSVRARDAAGNTSTISTAWTSINGLVLHYPWEQGHTHNTSLLAQNSTYSPDGTVVLPIVGGWAGTAAGSPGGHTYPKTIRPLSSSADGTYTASIWVRFASNSNGGVVMSTLTANNGFQLSVSGRQASLRVNEGGQAFTANAVIPQNQWVQLGVLTRGPGTGLQLLVNGNVVGTAAAPSVTGFDAGQADDLTVGPVSGADLDDLRFYNRGLATAEFCPLLLRGQVGAQGLCVPLIPGFELDFENNQVRDTGRWGLTFVPPNPQLISFVPTKLGNGLRLNSSDQSFGFSAGFASQINQAPGHSFSFWFVAGVNAQDTLIDFLHSCAVGAAALCGVRVTYSTANGLTIIAGPNSPTTITKQITLANGPHSVVVTEQKVNVDLTQSLTIYVDGTPTLMPVGIGNVYANPSDTVLLPHFAGTSVDEYEFWPRDLSLDPEMLCENGWDGEWDLAAGVCLLTSN